LATGCKDLVTFNLGLYCLQKKQSIIRLTLCCQRLQIVSLGLDLNQLRLGLGTFGRKFCGIDVGLTQPQPAGIRLCLGLEMLVFVCCTDFEGFPTPKIEAS